MRLALDTCDQGCPNGHYPRNVTVLQSDDVRLDHRGHPLVCSLDNECTSRLRILRSASTHYPILRTFLRALNTAIKSNSIVSEIDKALVKGDFLSLTRLTNIDQYKMLLSNCVNSTYENNLCTAKTPLRKAGIELDLTIKHAKMIAQYEKEVRDYAEHACCSCQQLFKRKNVTKVKLTDSLGKVVWPLLKDFMHTEDEHVSDNQLYMCNYCKPLIRKDTMPARCVLNGLRLVKIPIELEKLDAMSRQFIQRAKGFQTIVRLGTYTKKVPRYNSLKACKGTMFFLPLPLHKTVETMEGVKAKGSNKISLPNPELYIIVNGNPTKNKVVWRNLVDVNNIKAAVNKLKEINFLYKDVDDESIDDTAKEVIEVVSNTASTMITKASECDISGFESLTIRNLDSQLSKESDIDQYKLMNVTEKPLDNRQRHLDVMCFPVLFPDGNFGKYYDREKQISNSEYIKSRLLNKDSRFRKDHGYVFYELWLKERNIGRSLQCA